jgi:ABC-type transport system substrate-binding protein
VPPGVFTNNSAYSNPELDKLFDQQRVQIDFEKRKAIYDTIQEIIWDAMVVLPLVAYSGVGAYRNTAMSNAFQVSDSSKESFARVKAPGSPSKPAASSGGNTPWLLAGGAAVVAMGSLWFWRRSRAEEEDHE